MNLKSKILIGVCLVLTAAVSACAASAGSPGQEDRDVITAEQISAASASDAYQIVQSMRPMWLRKRGSQNIRNEGDIVVYYDNARMGGPAALRGISPTAITSIRFFDAAEANFRWGMGHTHGVILVLTQ
jgi:hypothetical protein